MTDFTHLKNYDVTTDNTAEYIFYSIDGEPKFIVSPATSANKRYYAKVAQKSTVMAKRLQGDSSGKSTVKAMDESRSLDRELFPSHIIKDWEGVVDSKGKPVDFSVKNCEAFLSCLPDYLFDELRNFANNPSNFTSLAGVEDTAKN